jgi:hypothetical protein
MRLRQTYYDRKFARLSKKLRGYPRGRSSQKGKWDLFHDLTTGSSSDLFLGVYGDLAIPDLLGEFGIFDALKGQGIHHPRIELDLEDAYRHILRVFDKDINPDTLVAELVFRRSRLPLSIGSKVDEKQLPCLHLEWILLQNPHSQFDIQHPAMPLQDLPGLALGDMTLSLIASLAKNLQMSGISTVPSNLHSALFFLRSYFAILPNVQAELLALKRAVRRYGRAEIVWAEQWGDVLFQDTGHVYDWQPTEMVQLLREGLRTWFEDQEHYQAELSHYQPKFVLRDGIQVTRLPDGRVTRDLQQTA